MKSQQQKRKEAEQRALEYATLTVDEKIQKALNSRGNSQKQLERLYGQAGI